jgi:exonuclease III
MRVVTWNMGRAKGASEYLLKKLDPDYALLQESYGREDDPHVCWEAIGNTSVKYGDTVSYSWGSAVWSRDHQLKKVDVGVPGGWVMAARPVDGPPLTLISVHVELDKEGRSIPILHRMLSDLTPTLEKRRGQLVMGGDLNADVVFDEHYGTRRHAIAFERIEDLGLWHCNRLIPPGRRRTFRGRSRGPVMDDHLFVRTSMANRVVSCEVVADEDVPGDHFPVMLELE